MSNADKGVSREEMLKAKAEMDKRGFSPSVIMWPNLDSFKLFLEAADIPFEGFEYLNEDN